MGSSDEADNGGKFVIRRLLEERTVRVFGPVDAAMTKRVISELLLLEADDPDAQITIVQNSPGGSVSDGFAIYDTIRFIRPEVRVLNVGMCASIATVILLGAPKEQRLSLPHTRFLIHQPLIAGNVYGPASDLEITAREILKMRDRINQMLADETGQPLDRVVKDTQRDYWMDAAAALEYGLISEIVEHRQELK